MWRNNNNMTTRVDISLPKPYKKFNICFIFLHLKQWFSGKRIETLEEIKNKTTGLTLRWGASM